MVRPNCHQHPANTTPPPPPPPSVTIDNTTILNIFMKFFSVKTRKISLPLKFTVGSCIYSCHLLSVASSFMATTLNWLCVGVGETISMLFVVKNSLVFHQQIGCLTCPIIWLAHLHRFHLQHNLKFAGSSYSRDCSNEGSKVYAGCHLVLSNCGMYVNVRTHSQKSDDWRLQQSWYTILSRFLC